MAHGICRRQKYDVIRTTTNVRNKQLPGPHFPKNSPKYLNVKCQSVGFSGVANINKIILYEFNTFSIHFVIFGANLQFN